MSGFVGILNLDGAPVARGLLERMTDALAFRGPDGRHTWSQGNVGLGHTLFRTTCESATEHQPATPDGRLRIVADARVDARAELLAELNPRLPGRHRVSLSTPDVELILRSYEVWGESCVDHLLGDFSFAIWDARNQKLFCARDQIGVKPFYYAKLGNTLLVGNTLQVLRLHPGASSQLSEAAIGEFLLFGLNLLPDASIFRDIKKLPPAHSLAAEGERLRISRYWSFPIEAPFSHITDRECIGGFRRILRLAVSDRLRTPAASVSLSGGLDSTTVAAAAVDGLKPHGSLHGITVSYDGIFPDREREFAKIAANYLGFPGRNILVKDYCLFERHESLASVSPEPQLLEHAAVTQDLYAFAQVHGGILLTGEGGDPGLVPSLTFYRGWRLPRFISDTAAYLCSHGRFPRLGFRLAWLRWRGLPTSNVDTYPRWLEPSFEKRAQLHERWLQVMCEAPRVHPDRPEAYDSVSQTHWSGYFEGSDPGFTGVPVEARHPLMDIRLLRFMLRLPTLPWCADKELLRVAMRGSLPEEILRRPKTPILSDPLVQFLGQPHPKIAEGARFDPCAELPLYVRPEQVPRIGTDELLSDPTTHLRPISLNFWLQALDQFGYKNSMGRVSLDSVPGD